LSRRVDAVALVLRICFVCSAKIGFTQLDLHLLFANLMELVQLVFHGLGSIMFIGIVQTYRLGVTLAERLPKPHINNIVLTLDNFHREILVRISIAIVVTI